ncbi:antitoxin Xre/MbcA/ParS toxin-binding domain-containing protein [Pectobacterium sp. LFLA-215]|uniref:antitoxin Xre/MbcA/ParS toxin-binding domain-containing protein n=1 Tax=Pectobacterium sp. LFLA-215 TaxID=3419008 RepID=UPI003F5B4765
MKISGRNPITYDVASLKKMTPVQRKTYGMSQLKNSFDAAVADGLLRVPAVSERAVELFEGDVASAEKWLAESNRALGWKTPNEMLSNPSGIDEVLRLIAQLQHGVYR